MKTMKTEVRIVAGSLRGRKIACKVSDDLRPTPQMVREAMFSILGNAIPGRPFIDIFAGTGVVGMEALSRGAKSASFVERDFALGDSIHSYIKKFDLVKVSKLYRTDCYRWIASWRGPAEPVNIFISPPFPDLTKRPESLLEAIGELERKVAPESVIVVQSERGSALDDRSELAKWERRFYGRNELLIWQKEDPAAPAAVEPPSPPAMESN